MRINSTEFESFLQEAKTIKIKAVILKFQFRSINHQKKDQDNIFSKITKKESKDPNTVF